MPVPLMRNRTVSKTLKYSMVKKNQGLTLHIVYCVQEYSVFPGTYLPKRTNAL